MRHKTFKQNLKIMSWYSSLYVTQLYHFYSMGDLNSYLDIQQ